MIKVVFHIDETNKWKLLIANVNNLYKGIDRQESEVEVLANSEAVAGLKKQDSVFSKELETLTELGVRICACNNSLKSMNIHPEELLDFIVVVPIGVKELIEKQHDGFAYIKP